VQAAVNYIVQKKFLCLNFGDIKAGT